MKDLSVVGIDSAKNVFQLYGIDHRGSREVSKKLQRDQLVAYIAQLPRCTIAMEACGGAHHWARQFQSLGHTVKLISAKYVKPFVKTNKNDYNDAQAITIAANQPEMLFVPIKTLAQHDIQSIHRVRERLVKKRTQLSNQIRGLLMEYGIVMPKGFSTLKRQLPELMSIEKTNVTPILRELLADLYQEFLELNRRILNYEKRLMTLSQQDSRCTQLLEIPGVGPMTATLLTAVMGDANYFKNGRHFAAYVGLVPKQKSSGGKERLLGISKRGHRYLRVLLIHGARAIITRLSSDDPSSQAAWLRSLVQKRGYHKTYVALANKNARIAWALLKGQVPYQAKYACGFAG